MPPVAGAMRIATDTNSRAPPPARSLYPRLRTLLVECAAPLREEIGTQRAAAEARSRPPENVEPPVSSAASEAAEASMGHAAGAPLRDPEVL